MRISNVFIFIVLVLICSGCSGSPTASGPSPLPLPSPPVPSQSSALPSPATAQLVIEQQSVSVFPVTAGQFLYEPRFLLRETTGKSGATIRDIYVEYSRETDHTWIGCWGKLRVPPGGTLDTFYTEAGARELSYCFPDASGNTEIPPVLRLVVSFK